MPRYAVLRDLDDAELRPIALVTEHDEVVRIHPTRELGVRREFSDPYSVLEPDGHEVIYKPGRHEYFDHVLLSLSRTFVIGELGERPTMVSEDIYELYLQKVERPRASERTSRYLDPSHDPAVPRGYARRRVYGPVEAVGARGGRLPVAA